MPCMNCRSLTFEAAITENSLLNLKKGDSMTQIVVNTNLKAQLRDLGEALEFRDEMGNLVGFFVPASSEGTMPSQELNLPFNAEELAGILSQPDGGRALADILAQVEKPDA